MPPVNTGKGPLHWFWENIPKISIATGLIYLFTVFVVTVFNVGADLMDTVTTIMLVGAVLAAPTIAIDLIFTRTVEPAEIIASGFINFFALLVQMAITKQDLFIKAATYMLYVYGLLLLVGMTFWVFTVFIYKGSTAPSKK